MRPVLPLPALQCTAATPRGCSCKKLCTCSQKACINASGGTCMCSSTLKHCLELFSNPLYLCDLRPPTAVCIFHNSVQQLYLRPDESSSTAAHLMIIEGKVCNHLEFGWLVCKVLLRAQVVHAVPSSLVLLLEKALHIPHVISVQPCTTDGKLLGCCLGINCT